MQVTFADSSLITNKIPADANVVWNMISDSDQQTITLPCHNARSRKLPVHSDHAVSVAQSGDVLHGDLQEMPIKQTNKD
jgi:hypothetical protein